MFIKSTLNSRLFKISSLCQLFFFYWIKWNKKTNKWTVNPHDRKNWSPEAATHKVIKFWGHPHLNTINRHTPYAYYQYILPTIWSLSFYGVKTLFTVLCWGVLGESRSHSYLAFCTFLNPCGSWPSGQSAGQERLSQEAEAEEGAMGWRDQKW